MKSTHVVKREVKTDQGTICDQAGSTLMLEAGDGDVYMTEDEKKFAEYIASVESQYLSGVSGSGEANKAHAESIHTSVHSSTTVAEETTIAISANSNVKEDSECLDKVATVGLSDLNSNLDTKSEVVSVSEPIDKVMAGDVNGITIEPSKSTAMVVEGDVEVFSTITMENKDLANLSIESEETKNDNGESKPNVDIITVGNENSNPEKVLEMDDDKASLYTEEESLGRVYVEFTREETACAAAHVLHGRVYGERKVFVRYFPVKLYQKRYGKGLEPRTHEEKQALALAAQEHLNTYLPERD